MTELQIMWTWWGSVVVINVINFSIGIFLFIKSRKEEDSIAPYRKYMRILGMVFISVAMYRSIFVSSYLEQLAWFDTLANSPLLIRSFAFFAELAFAYLIMKVLLQVNKDIPVPESHKANKLFNFFETKTPYVFFILLLAAQPFAYGGTIFKLHLLFAIEETFWGLAFLLIAPLIIIQLKRVYSFKDVKSKSEFKHYRIFTVFMTIFTVGYSFYSVFYHLPIEYWPFAIEQMQSLNPEPAIQTGFQAFKNAFLIVNKTHDYTTWGGIGFIIWHSGYFTLCGWMVLFFMNGPRKLEYKE